jgi:NAD(P)H-binding
LRSFDFEAEALAEELLRPLDVVDTQRDDDLVAHRDYSLASFDSRLYDEPARGFVTAMGSWRGTFGRAKQADIEFVHEHWIDDYVDGRDSATHDGEPEARQRFVSSDERKGHKRRMRVVIFGASGATGRELVAQALVQRHQVTAFVRNVSRLGPRSSDVRVVQGDVTDPSVVTRAVEGQHGVLCALGAATPLRRDRTLIEGVHHIVDAMSRFGVRRLVYLSFLGVRDGRRQLSVIGRFVVAPLLLRNVVAITRRRNRSSGGVNWNGSSYVRRD